MALESVNTNMGAMVALQSLENTQQQLSVTQKQISTGFRVADSTDDGAAYAIAQSIRSNVGALTSANQQLGTVTQYTSMLAQVKTDIQDANYNGKTLIGDLTGSNGSFGRVAVARNESGSSYGITIFSGSAVYNAISFGGTAAGSVLTGTGAAGASAIAALLTQGGTFLTQQSSVGQGLNAIGNSINYVNSQTTYNNDKINALNTGLGSLVDADLAKESAQLTALQIRQQLGTQALSLANQAPQSLLSLFK
jgi:flagellin